MTSGRPGQAELFPRVPESAGTVPGTAGNSRNASTVPVFPFPMGERNGNGNSSRTSNSDSNSDPWAEPFPEPPGSDEAAARIARAAKAGE